MRQSSSVSEKGEDPWTRPEASSYKERKWEQRQRYEYTGHARWQGRLNPPGVDGEPLLCHSCGSFRHLIAQCPDSWENLKKQASSDDGCEDNIELLHGLKASISLLGVEARKCAVIDIKCSSTVCGKDWLDDYVDSLSEDDRGKVTREMGKRVFKFGAGEKFESLAEIHLPAVMAGKQVTIKTDVIDSEIPLLLSQSSMKKANMILDIGEDTVQIFSRKVGLTHTLTGQCCVNLENPLALRQGSGQCEKYQQDRRSLVEGDQVYFQREDQEEWLGPATLYSQNDRVALVRYEGAFMRGRLNRMVKIGRGFISDVNVEGKPARRMNREVYNGVKCTVENDGEWAISGGSDNRRIDGSVARKKSWEGDGKIVKERSNGSRSDRMASSECFSVWVDDDEKNIEEDGDTEVMAGSIDRCDSSDVIKEYSGENNIMPVSAEDGVVVVNQRKGMIDEQDSEDMFIKENGTKKNDDKSRICVGLKYKHKCGNERKQYVETDNLKVEGEGEGIDMKLRQQDEIHERLSSDDYEGNKEEIDTIEDQKLDGKEGLIRVFKQEKSLKEGELVVERKNSKEKKWEEVWKNDIEIDKYKNDEYEGQSQTPRSRQAKGTELNEVEGLGRTVVCNHNYSSVSADTKVGKMEAQELQGERSSVVKEVDMQMFNADKRIQKQKRDEGMTEMLVVDQLLSERDMREVLDDSMHTWDSDNEEKEHVDEVEETENKEEDVPGDDVRTSYKKGETVDRCSDLHRKTEYEDVNDNSVENVTSLVDECISREEYEHGGELCPGHKQVADPEPVCSGHEKRTKEMQEIRRDETKESKYSCAVEDGVLLLVISIDGHSVSSEVVDCRNISCNEQVYCRGFFTDGACIRCSTTVQNRDY